MEEDNNDNQREQGKSSDDEYVALELVVEEVVFCKARVNKRSIVDLESSFKRHEKPIKDISSVPLTFTYGEFKKFFFPFFFFCVSRFLFPSSG